MNAPATAAEVAVEPAIGAHLISLAAIVPSKTNPRKHFDPDALTELTASVKQHGVLQPILVRAHPKPSAEALWELVAGERRYRAAKAAGLDSILAVTRRLTDIQALELQCIENLQRADLHPLEEAEGYEALRKCDPNYNADSIAAKLGKSRSYVFGRMKLTALCEEARQAFYGGKLTPSTALLIARIPAPKLQLEAIRAIAQPQYRPEPLSYREAADLVQRQYMLALSGAVFNIKDASLLPAAGACGPCPKRTGNQSDLFGDVKNANVCTDPQCFAAKKEAHFVRRRREFEQAGRKIIDGAAAKKLIPNGYSTPKGYLDLNNTVDDGKGFPKAGEVAKKLNVETTLVEHPKTRELLEVVADSALQAAMKKAGLVRRSTNSSRSASDNENAKAAKAETAIRTQIMVALHDAPFNVAREDFVCIAQAFYADIYNEYRKKVLALWGWTGLPEDDGAAADPIERAIAALSNEDLVRFMLECALIKQVPSAVYHDDGCLELEAAAKRRGVDVAGIRSAAKAKAKEKVLKKAKKTPAKKAGARKSTKAKADKESTQ